MIRNTFIATCATAICLVGQGVKPADDRSLPVPADLLTSAVDAEKEMSAVDRCYFFVELLASGARLKDDRVAAWAQQALKEIKDLSTSWNRTALQKNVLVALSSVDPDEALRLLPTLELTRSRPEEVPAEDVRASAARIIFNRVWQESKNTAAIEPAANAIGETGQYPFIPMAAIILDVDKTEPPESARLFSVALSFYSRGDPTRSTTPDYVEFLLKVQDVIPGWQLIEGVRAAVNRLTDDSQDLFGKESFIGSSAKGSIVTSSRRDYLLLQLMPLVRRLDASWADRLSEKNQALKSGIEADETKYSSTVIGGGDASSGHARNMQREHLDRLKSVLTDQPDSAIAQLPYLTDPQFRAQALGLLVSRLWNERPELAKRFQADLDSLLASTADARVRLKIHAALAAAAAAHTDGATFMREFNTLIDLAGELVQQQKDAKPGAALPELYGFDDLCELATKGAKLEPWPTVEAIGRVRSAPLRATLLVRAATGLPVADSAK